MRHQLPIVLLSLSFALSFTACIVEAPTKEGTQGTAPKLPPAPPAEVKSGANFGDSLELVSVILNPSRGEAGQPLSVLASDEPFLEPAFQSLGVPPPVVTSVSRSRARRPKPADFVLATAVMRLLVNVLTGELAPLPLGAGATIELKRDVPKSKSKSKSKRAVTKRPAAKKKVATKTPTRKA